MKVIQISRLDNVAVALHPIKKGEEVTAGGITVTALEDIPQGHKIALKPIKNGENIIKYGFAIGHATADAEAGAWMHTHNAWRQRSTADSAREIRCEQKLSNRVCKKDVNLWEKRQVMRKPLKRTLSKA